MSERASSSSRRERALVSEGRAGGAGAREPVTSSPLSTSGGLLDTLPRAAPDVLGYGGLAGLAELDLGPVQRSERPQAAPGGGMRQVVQRTTLTGNPDDLAPRVETRRDGSREVVAPGTVHRAPTLQDSDEAPEQAPDAAVETGPALVKVLRDRSRPIEGDYALNADLYEVLPAPQQPAPAESSGGGGMDGGVSSGGMDGGVTSVPSGPPDAGVSGGVAAPAGFVQVHEMRGVAGRPLVEQVADNEIFIDRQPRPEDVMQNQIGDCYILATAASIAQRDPGKLQSMMTPDGQGGATVTFWRRAGAAQGQITYEQVQVAANNELAFERSEASALGTADPSERALDEGHFVIHGAQLLHSPQPTRRTWWAEVESEVLGVYRRDVYTLARWVPLLEKAHARFSQTYGVYGGANDNDGHGPGPQGYEIQGQPGRINSILCVFYGAQFDPAALNGNLQVDATTWSPGIANLAEQNAGVVDQLLELARGGSAPVGGRTRIVTASTDSNAHIRRASEAILALQRGPDWRQLPRDTRRDLLEVLSAIRRWEGAVQRSGESGATAQRDRVAAAAARAIEGDRLGPLAMLPRSNALMILELLADVSTAGTDSSDGQRYIYGAHAYSVEGATFRTISGQPLADIAMLSGEPRSAAYRDIDVTRTIVRMRNPHHMNEPDIDGDGNTMRPPEEPADADSRDGAFVITLESFIRNFGHLVTANVLATPVR